MSVAAIEIVASGREAKRGPKVMFPKSSPQYTFQEVARASLCLSACADLNSIQAVRGETSFSHTIKGKPLQIKINVSDVMSRWLGLDELSSDERLDRLRAEMQTANLDTVLLLQVVTGLALKFQHVNCDVDDLIRALGWQSYSLSEREQMRLTVWRWMMLIEAMEITGQRKGRFRDRETGREIMTASWQPLIRFTAYQYEASKDNSQAPLNVSFVAGRTLHQYRENRQVLSDIGDVLKIARIPRGKASGAWACGISLTLNYLWRVNATNATVDKSADASVKFGRYFTRAELLKMHKPVPSVESIVSGKNPKRAVEYWDKAINEAKKIGVIGYYEEVGKPIPPADKRSKTDYQYWLNEQQLDIRPTEDTANEVLEILGNMTKARRKRGRKPKPKEGGNSLKTVANSLKTVGDSLKSVANLPLTVVAKGRNFLKYERVKHAPSLRCRSTVAVPSITTAMGVQL